MQVRASLLISQEQFILLFGLDDENGAVGVPDAVIADTPEESPAKPTRILGHTSTTLTEA
jgi:hypothetical protein